MRGSISHRKILWSREHLHAIRATQLLIAASRVASGPYIDYIRRLAKQSNGWPHLQYLADFMDVTTAPVKHVWVKNDPEDMEERAHRTKVAILDFVPDHLQEKVLRKDCDTIDQLHEALLLPQDKDDNITGRLYVVEDLSRDVIEALGAKFDIDPRFFRAQISDYTWHNPREPWVEFPSLSITSHQRSFFCIRYFQPRYFPTKECFAKARTLAGGFNVLRRLDNNRPWEGTDRFDKPKSDIGLVRSKLSLWDRKNTPDQTMMIGVLLVDPTIKEGYPLWGGYPNFEDCPSMNDTPQAPSVSPRPEISMFEDVISRITTMSAADIRALSKDPRLFVNKPLYIICAEWITVIKYLTTRMTQLEWELDNNPITPFQHPEGLDAALVSLNTWRRRIPYYYECLAEAMQRVVTAKSFMGQPLTESALLPLKDDFEELQAGLKAVAERADRIQTAVSTSISITENKKAIELNRTATRLTYLAVIFVPLTWVSGLFSMQSNFGPALNTIIWQYFSVALPLTIAALLALIFYPHFMKLWAKLGAWWKRRTVAQKLKEKREKAKKSEVKKDKTRTGTGQEKLNENGQPITQR
jgi:hypothetical protein